MSDDRNYTLYEAHNTKTRQVYVGITGNTFNHRLGQHKADKRSAVKYELFNSPDVEFNVVDNLTKEEAIALEKSRIADFRSTESGVDIINVRHGGEIGGGDPIWTFDLCVSVMRTCRTGQEFREGHRGAYKHLYKKGLLDRAYDAAGFSKPDRYNMAYVMEIASQ